MKFLRSVVRLAYNHRLNTRRTVSCSDLRLCDGFGVSSSFCSDLRTKGSKTSAIRFRRANLQECIIRPSVVPEEEQHEEKTDNKHVRGNHKLGEEGKDRQRVVPSCPTARGIAQATYMQRPEKRFEKNRNEDGMQADVKMIGGLVQQEEVRTNKESLSQRNSHPMCAKWITFPSAATGHCSPPSTAELLVSFVVSFLHDNSPDKIVAALLSAASLSSSSRRSYTF
eukprot:749795-Hanusia_phi.AAC.13